MASLKCSPFRTLSSVLSCIYNMPDHVKVFFFPSPFFFFLSPSLLTAMTALLFSVTVFPAISFLTTFQVKTIPLSSNRDVRWWLLAIRFRANEQDKTVDIFCIRHFTHTDRRKRNELWELITYTSVNLVNAEM